MAAPTFEMLCNSQHLCARSTIFYAIFYGVKVLYRSPACCASSRTAVNCATQNLRPPPPPRERPPPKLRELLRELLPPLRELPPKLLREPDELLPKLRPTPPPRELPPLKLLRELLLAFARELLAE